MMSMIISIPRVEVIAMYVFYVLVTLPVIHIDQRGLELDSIQAIGEAALANLEENTFIQLERRGYYRVDRPYMGPNKPIVLFQIPDGKRKNMSHLTSNIQRVEVAQYDAKVKATKEKKAAAKQKEQWIVTFISGG